MLTFKVTLETEPQSLEKPTAETAIADAHRLLSLGEPRYAAVAARNAIQVLLLDGCRAAMVWPTSMTTGETIKGQWYTHAHLLAAAKVISSDLHQQVTRAFDLARRACHIYPLTMDKVQIVLTTAETLFAVVKGKRA